MFLFCYIYNLLQISHAYDIFSRKYIYNIATNVATPAFNSNFRAKRYRRWLALNQPSCFAELVILALRILSASSNRNRKRLKTPCNFYLQICAAPPSVRRIEIHCDKGCHTALITIKQGNQHAVPNRNLKHNQAETTIHYSLRHVHVLTRKAKIHVVIIYTRLRLTGSFRVEGF